MQQEVREILEIVESRRRIRKRKIELEAKIRSIMEEPKGDFKDCVKKTNSFENERKYSTPVLNRQSHNMLRVISEGKGQSSYAKKRSFLDLISNAKLSRNNFSEVSQFQLKGRSLGGDAHGLKNFFDIEKKIIYNFSLNDFREAENAMHRSNTKNYLNYGNCKGLPAKPKKKNNTVKNRKITQKLKRTATGFQKNFEDFNSIALSAWESN